MMEEGENAGVMDRFPEQRAWVVSRKKTHKINKMGFKQGHLQCLRVSKEVPTRHHYGEMPKYFLGMLGVPL